MEEILGIVADNGIAFVITGIVLFFALKHGDEVLKIWIQRMKDKNYLVEITTKTIENNTIALDNNSKVIENYTKNSHKMEKILDNLGEKVEEMAKDITKGNLNIETLKTKCLTCRDK